MAASILVSTFRVVDLREFIDDSPARGELAGSGTIRADALWRLNYDEQAGPEDHREAVSWFAREVRFGMRSEIG